MPAIEPLSRLLGSNSTKLSKDEFLILEAELFLSVCEGIKELFRKQYANYFGLMKFTMEDEKNMLEVNFVRLIINDILNTEEYNLEGISKYTGMPEDVVEEVISGLNSTPSALFLQRIIELHRSIRPELYISILKKMTMPSIPWP